jgi:hypothetical protein
MNRRAVLRQTVKLAYATPLIVVSVRLTDFKAAGATHSDCGLCEEFVGGVCVPADFEGCD